MDMDPRFTPDGRFVVFASDRTGIANIFAYELATKRLFQVTNVLSGAYQPAISPDGRRLVFTGFTSDGFDLWTMPFDPATFQPAQPFANARLDAPEDLDGESDSPDARPEDAAGAVHDPDPRPTRPGSTSTRGSGNSRCCRTRSALGNTLQVQTSLSDPVVTHVLGVNSVVPGGRAARVAGRLLVQPALADAVGLGGGVGHAVARAHRRRPEPRRTGSGPSAPRASMRLAGHAAGGRVGRRHARLRLLGVRHGRRGADRRSDGAHHRSAGGRARSRTCGWGGRSRNAHRWPYSISNQTGRNLSLTLRLLDPALGGRFHGTEVSWTWSEYLTPPWARLHALALLTQGGFGFGDKRDFFSLGGYADQDVVRALLLNQQQFAFLRGYPVNVVSGDSYLVLTAEYRAPLLWIERGYQTRLRVPAAHLGDGLRRRRQRVRGAVPARQAEDRRRASRPTSRCSSSGSSTPSFSSGVAHGFASGGGNRLYFVSSFSF